MKITSLPHAIPKPISTAPIDGSKVYILDTDSRAIFEATWFADGSSLIDGILVKTGTWDCTVGGWMELGEVDSWLTRDEVHIEP